MSSALFIHVVTHLFNKHLLNVNYVPPEDTVPVLQLLIKSVWEADVQTEQTVVFLETVQIQRAWSVPT